MNIKSKIAVLSTFLLLTLVMLISSVAAFLVDRGLYDNEYVVGMIDINFAIDENNTDINMLLTSPTCFYDTNATQFNESVKKATITITNNSNIDIKFYELSIINSNLDHGIVYVICPNETAITDYYSYLTERLSISSLTSKSFSALKSAIGDINDSTIDSIIKDGSAAKKYEVGSVVKFDIYIWEEYYNGGTAEAPTSKYDDITSLISTSVDLSITVKSIQYDYAPDSGV